MLSISLAVCLGLLAGGTLRAGGWPEWRGKDRAGVWNETGILETFPAEGLKVKWRAPVGSGFSGPGVAGGRVFVADFEYARRSRGVERVLAFDERAGKLLWEQK